MAITIRLGKEEEQKLREGAAQHDSDLSNGLQILTGAMRAAFAGLDSEVRWESEDGTLIAEEALRTTGSLQPVPLPDPADIASIEAMPREAGMAFGRLAGKGNPEPALRDVPFREQVAAASRAASARKARRLAGPARGGDR